MSFNGFIRVAAAMPVLKIGNCAFNTEQIIGLIDNAIKDQVSLIVFPELSITGYTCSDLFFQQKLLDEAKKQLISLKHYSANKNIAIIVGLPLKVLNCLYNCAVFISNGKIEGIVPKTYLPNYNEFYEHRWFASSRDLLDEELLIDSEYVPIGSDLIFAHHEIDFFKIGIEICEDLWSPIPPSTWLALNGATILVNPSASNEVVGKCDYRKSLISNQSARTISAYVYSSAGFGESTTDVVYGGHCIIYENGTMLIENERFQLASHYIMNEIDLDRLTSDRIKNTTYRDSSHLIRDRIYREIFFDLVLPHIELKRFVDPHPFVPKNKTLRDYRCKEIFSIQTLSLAKRLTHIGGQKVVLGISGGLDSTLALLVCVKTFETLNIDKNNILAVTMPGFGTTNRTYNNAVQLIHSLGASFIEIPIKEACLQHFEAIGHNPESHDLTYENTQARERTQILMDLATKENAFVIGTGDLSELALGWATYNGDHMSMYGVNVSIPKTLVRYLVEWVAFTATDEITKTILLDVLDTPVSPELLPPDQNDEILQKTEEVVGPYELHDFFLYHMIRFGYTPQKIFLLSKQAFKDTYSNETILMWLRTFYKRFFSQQFKRSCMPDGPKVGSICLSPRGDWRMPSDADVNTWLLDIESL